MPPKRKAPSQGRGGTGYGGAQGDTQRLLAGRKKAEKQGTSEDAARTKYLKDCKAALERNLSKASKAAGGEPEAGGPTDSLINEREKDKVAKDLAEIFRNQTPTDWDDRKDLYNAAFDLCRTLASDVRLGAVFGEKDDPEGVLYWLVDFSRQAEAIQKRGADDDVVIWSDAEQQDYVLATQVAEVRDAALKVSRLCHSKKKPVEELSIVSLSERYQSILGPLRFETVDSLSNHYFLRTAPTAPSGFNMRLRWKELCMFKAALPIEYGSSCFCRVIDSRLDMLRVMITGPDDTPYANGCFLFDVNLPASYPQVAPKVHFLTTGGGKMRFNPNLYQCGKVCLSLLGTWQGPGWVSGESTLLQVLVSIQSLILVPDPYFNEPGWERERGTPRGAINSKNYNRNIRRYTMEAALDNHLSAILSKTNTHPEFEEAMKKHFLEKRSLIEQEIRQWSSDDPTVVARVERICSLLAQLAQAEREARRAATRAKKAGAVAATMAAATNSNDPICLDSDGEVDDDAGKKSANGGEAIEIDFDDDDGEEKKSEVEDGDKKPEAVAANDTSGVDGIIDLT
mmetsp:Transcript_6926/g.16503  ORF Transcript_6926/g.16503 Transcript_6926/m.16503 type:complete len:568 (-) Transcript_6926:195-1898(-)|eukprot:CAMPEP_0185813136 /NCGR_PEP_ID=MMETSP1322-20130828/10867_1 /TAXON_ID=265543 /ORGANISM="Minutocellus polymorphus, Strain RCC2270" /LENGTH=567 /DNA_ID=CAMNT_0028509769 /DNA_START=209 /DNA_END=1912 /DNA_ORIENTATION=-